MRSITELLQRPRPTLIFSLPRNDPELAQAALDAGAEALKVHIHVRHQASGTGFGDLEAEAPALGRIRAIADVPIGVVVGDANAMASEAEMGRLVEIGADFFDAYARHLPAWMLNVEEIERMGALASEDDAEDWRAIASLFDCVEAAVLDHGRYGETMTAYDLALYSRIRKAVAGPIVVPTQLALRPREIGALVEVGIDAIMIGAIVTGMEPGTVAAACRDFRAACDAIA